MSNSEKKRLVFQYVILFDRVLEYKGMEVTGIVVKLLLRAFAKNGMEIYPRDETDALDFEQVANSFLVYASHTSRDLLVTPIPMALDGVIVRGIDILRANATVVGLDLNIVDYSEEGNRWAELLRQISDVGGGDARWRVKSDHPTFCSAGDRVTDAEVYDLYDRHRDSIADAYSEAFIEDYSWLDVQDGEQEFKPHITTAKRDYGCAAKITCHGAVRIAIG